MKKLKVLDLFSGIGGFSLGLDRTGGFETVAFCEIDPFCRKVLRKHWPDVSIYEDIRELTADRLTTDGVSVNLITGGFPCQEISVVGRRWFPEGMSENRSGLWSEFLRIISDLQPNFVVMENTPGLLTRGLSEILGALAAVRFDAQWHCIPAANIGARHIRDRVWIVAYPCRNGLERPIQIANSIAKGLTTHHRCPPSGTYGENTWESWASQPVFLGNNDDVPDWMDRIKSIGNAVVPQIPELIGYAILEAEKQSEVEND